MGVWVTWAGGAMYEVTEPWIGQHDLPLQIDMGNADYGLFKHDAKALLAEIQGGRIRLDLFLKIEVLMLEG